MENFTRMQPQKRTFAIDHQEKEKKHKKICREKNHVWNPLGRSCSRPGSGGLAALLRWEPPSGLSEPEAAKPPEAVLPYRSKGWNEDGIDMVWLRYLGEL